MVQSVMSFSNQPHFPITFSTQPHILISYTKCWWVWRLSATSCMYLIQNGIMPLTNQLHVSNIIDICFLYFLQPCYLRIIWCDICNSAQLLAALLFKIVLYWRYDTRNKQSLFANETQFCSAVVIWRWTITFILWEGVEDFSKKEHRLLHTLHFVNIYQSSKRSH